MARLRFGLSGYSEAVVLKRPDHGPTHDPHRGADPRTVITNARESASDDLSRRQKQYFIAMAFRVACFVGMVFVPGAGRWVLLGIAVIIPTIAVSFANQADRRSPRQETIVTGTPSAAPELTIAPSDIITGETDDPVNPSADHAFYPDRRADPPVSGAA